MKWNKKTLETLDNKLPLPFDILHLDYRTNKFPEKELLKVVSWNIERGYCLNNVIAEMKKLDADIYLLQEIDIGNVRSQNKNVFTEILSAMKMNGIYVSEFEELYSPARETSSQGGGVHGNAIITKFDIIESFTVVHSKIINWERDGLWKYREPRKGGRVTIGAVIGGTPVGNILSYSAHMESFSDCSGRRRMIREILTHSNEYLSNNNKNKKKNKNNISTVNGRLLPFINSVEGIILGGDFNSFVSGWGRLSKFIPFKRFFLRFHHLGITEAQCMDNEIKKIGIKIVNDSNNNNSITIKNSTNSPHINNFSKFFPLEDPFDKRYNEKTWTLEHFYGLFKHKLDFIYYSKNSFCCVFSCVGGTNKESDHKWVVIELKKK